MLLQSLAGSLPQKIVLESLARVFCKVLLESRLGNPRRMAVSKVPPGSLLEEFPLDSSRRLLWGLFWELYGFLKKLLQDSLRGSLEVR